MNKSFKDTSKFPLLNSIESPSSIKKIDRKKLPLLATEIRKYLIEVLSNYGGHLGPNLGVIELTIALHRVFDSPKDKILFDVSHQGYIHKMLTGRLSKIHTIRQFQGLNGFLCRNESEHDCYGAGHAGTALSAALGFSVARDIKKENSNVIAVAGDAAFTCGITYEALNNISETTKKMIIILNDNEWSISKNTGLIAKYLNQIRTHDSYNSVRYKADKFIKKIGGISTLNLVKKIETGAKNLILPNILFEEFGLDYYGPIDGHNIDTLEKTLLHLKKKNQPVLLHIITEKGKGYTPALKNPCKFHGLGPYNPKDGKTKASSLPTFSEIFSQTITDFSQKDKKIVAITAAMSSGTKLEILEKQFPERFFDTGIAEEHAALFSAGLSARGIKPFLCIYSTFMQRAFDMIVHDIALQNLPVRLCMDRAGLSGDDGPTHHGLFDIGYLRHIPNIIHMQPKDETEFVDMLWTMANYNKGPIAIRYPRGTGIGELINRPPQILEIGKGEILQKGSEITLIGLGNLFSMAQETKKILEEKGYSCTLINPRWIKPIDEELICKATKNCKIVCTFEDHTIINGFGSSIIELLHRNNISTPVECIAWQDQFIEHGSVNHLREKYGITSENATKRILSRLEKTL